MVDADEAGVGVRLGRVGRIDGIEIDLPPAGALGVVDEIDQAAADAAHGGHFDLAGGDGLAERRGEEAAGAALGRLGIGHLEAPGAHAGAVGDVEGMGETLALGIDDEGDGALGPDLDLLGAVTAGAAEAEARDEAAELGRGGFVEGELDEFDALDGAARRQGQRSALGVRRDVGEADAVGEGEEGALAVDGDGAGGAGAELVVEDLEGEDAVVAGGADGIEEVGDGEVALSGHGAEVAAPGEQVEGELGGVGELDEEEAVGGDGADRGGVDAAGEGVEAVEDEADGGMVGAADDLPGVAVIVDEAAPGESFVADAQAAAGGARAEGGEIVGGAVDAAEGVGGDVGADEEEVGAELLHEVELALGAVEGAPAQGLGQAFEIAEGLEQGDLEAFLAHQPAGLAGRQIEGEEVVLEDLHPVEPRPGDRRQLLRKVPAQRHRRNRRLHPRIPSFGEVRPGRTADPVIPVRRRPSSCGNGAASVPRRGRCR